MNLFFLSNIYHITIFLKHCSGKLIQKQQKGNILGGGGDTGMLWLHKTLASHSMLVKRVESCKYLKDVTAHTSLQVVKDFRWCCSIRWVESGMHFSTRFSKSQEQSTFHF